MKKKERQSIRKLLAPMPKYQAKKIVKWLGCMKKKRRKKMVKWLAGMPIAASWETADGKRWLLTVRRGEVVGITSDWSRPKLLGEAADGSNMYFANRKIYDCNKATLDFGETETEQKGEGDEV